MNTLKANNTVPTPDVIEIEEGSFFVSFSQRGLELLIAAASYSLAALPPKEVARASLEFIIQENLDWALYEFMRDHP